MACCQLLQAHLVGHAVQDGQCLLVQGGDQELKRRTRAARVFPNEQSLLRLICALLAETSDDWETGKIHLKM